MEKARGAVRFPGFKTKGRDYSACWMLPLMSRMAVTDS